MSDKNSESSEEWIVLNENEDLSPDNDEEPQLNLQLSYDAVCDAVSESIRSSFSSEELEWQYEQFPDFIPHYGSSCIEELDYNQFDTESKENLDVINAEDDDTSKFPSDFEDDKSIDSIPVKKIKCYKHNRNDHLNFVLNLSMALVLASAVGLGIGHFLGWSHKCNKSTTRHNTAYSSNELDGVVYSPKLPDILTMRENGEDSTREENQILDAAYFSDNLSDISCWDSKDGEKSDLQEVCISHTNIDIVTDAILPEAPILLSENVLEFKTEEINQNNISDSISPTISHIVADDKWYQIATPLKDLNEQLEQLERSPRGINPTDTENTDDFLSSFDINDDVVYKFAVNIHNFKAFKSIFENETPKEKNLTNQLRQDLSQIIQSLRAIAVARLTQGTDNYPMMVKNFEVILKYYIEFEDIVNLKLTEIDDFVSSSDYKKYEKVSLKHLQKMIYCLIDSVDYLMKISVKTLNRDYERINIQKFSNNISKVIFNFNRKWDKNNRIWSQSVAKLKFQEIKEEFFKKEDRYYKQKSNFDKEFRNNKHRRYSMKS